MARYIDKKIDKALNKKIAERIKSIRIESGKKQADFAKSIGITASAMSKLETGENFPSTQTLKLICQNYKINENWLLDGKGQQSSIKENKNFSMILEEIEEGDDNFIREMIMIYMELDDISKKALCEYVHLIASKLK